MAVFDPALYDSQAPGTTFRGLTWTDVDSERPDVRRRGARACSGAARRLRLRPLGRRLDAAPRRLRHVQLPRRAGAVLGLHRPAVRRDVHQRHQQPATVGRRRTSTRTRSPASAAPFWPPTTSSRGRRAGASRVQRRLPYQMTIEAGYVGSKSDRLLNDGLNNLNIVPFGAMLNDPNGDPNLYRPLPRVRRPAGVAAHALPELQRAADAPQPGELEVQLHGVVHVVEGARHPRRRPGRRRRSPPATSATRAYGILGYDRTHVLNIGYSYLLPIARRLGRAQEGDSRRLAVHRRVDVHQRRAAAAAGVDWRELRHGRHDGRPVPTWAATRRSPARRRSRRCRC